MKKLKDVNQAQLEIFLNKYKHKDQMINTVKQLDGSSLPPYCQVLLEKFTHMSNTWRFSPTSQHPILSLLNYGWKLTNENRFEMIWLHGDICPKKLNVVINQDFDREDNEMAKFDISFLNFCEHECD